MTTVPRWAWVLLAMITAAWGAFAASNPILQITDCEIGLSAISPSECNESIWSYFGNSMVIVLVLPAMACLLPVAVPRISAAWTVAGLLVVASVLGFSEAMSSIPSLLGVYGFYLPIAFLAVLLAIRGQAITLRQRRVSGYP
ncbi:hypothetical protein HCA61_09625 [Rhodococcus sp. HNM0563]|uniref:hypothetical protein n=1 Tax=unclassified Rhodococcus (in: high G+C Gram-positive bacteria) TaxID=192944 RepID=UPI00146C1358|nr:MULTISPECIES: hypothetical protein [unclassified Rhodococcus (in: high G+C Gram-positive bacteria)]MCK0089538.1 hypothetical protein [Rhodococcus sp. F64268]NLU62525.1 hypothetical protein [Rhodococcus sp. HNM0563]